MEENIDREQIIKKHLYELQDINYKDWNIVKSLIDNEFSRIKEKSTFSCSEDTLEHLKVIL